MKVSKKATLISYILQTISFITIMTLTLTHYFVKATPYIAMFVFLNIICVAVMHQIFMKELMEYSTEIYDKLHTEYPYVNHFKYLCYAFSSNEKDKPTKTLLKFHHLFFVMFFVEFIVLDLCNYIM